MNKFLLRTPSFSLDLLNDLWDSEDAEDYIFQKFINDSLFRESIYLYSKVLYNQACRYSIDEAKRDLKRKNIANSLIKYFLRMSYRATPFGVSAGISVSEFDGVKIQSSINYGYRSIKIDSGVYFNIIEAINSIDDVKNSIKYYTNNTLYSKSNHYKYLERVKLEKSFDFVIGKVDKTEVLDCILGKAKNGIMLSDVLELFSDDDISEKEIKDFFYEIIDLQLIVSELQYDVLNIHFQNDFLRKLRLIAQKHPNRDLKSVMELLESVLSLSLKLENERIYSNIALDLIKKIEDLLNPYNETNKSSIQVDLINETEDKISSKTRYAIQKRIPAFIKLNSLFGSEDLNLKNFKQQFSRRYNNRIVDLLEVFDSDGGIGYPANANVNNNSYLLKEINVETKKNISSEFTSLDAFILEKYESAIRKGNDRITLFEKDFSFFLNSSENLKEVDDTILFTGQMFLDNQGKGMYYVNSLKVGGAHFIANRFAYGNTKIQEFCKILVQHEKQKLNPDVVYADLLHLSQPRLGNVTLRSNYYKYYIPIIDVSNHNLEYEIPLRDLAISIQDDEVILYSKKLQKRVIPRLGCAQNTSFLTNPIYKFLGAVTNSYFLQTWDWKILSNMKYLPRVEFEDFILSKEKWLVNYDDVFRGKSESTEILESFLIENGVYKNVTLSLGGDNLLPLNLSKTKCLNILKKELKTRKNVLLEECLYSKDNLKSFTYNDKGETTNEICVPLLLNTKNRNKQNENIGLKMVGTLLNPEKEPINTKLFPFQESLYIKIYVKSGINVDKTFNEKLLLVILELENIIKNFQFFFIRYLDPNYHFRFRFFVPNNDHHLIVKKINTIFNAEIKSLLIEKIQIDTYEREMERYGGEVGIKISEEIFYHDSICVLRSLSWTYKNKKERFIWLFALVGVNYLLNDFLLSNSEKIAVLEGIRNYYLNIISNKKQVRKDISKFYKENKSLICYSIDNTNFEKQFYPYYKERSSYNTKLINELIQQNIKVEVESYIHMFLNRFLESNQNIQETLIYDLLILYYKQFEYNKIKNENNNLSFSLPN